MAIFKGPVTLLLANRKKPLGAGRCVLLTRDSPQWGRTTTGTIIITQWYDRPPPLDHRSSDYLLLFEDGRTLAITVTRRTITENGTGPEVLRFTGDHAIGETEGAAAESGPR